MLDGSGYFTSQCAYGYAFKPGGGAWLANSDGRIKNILGDYKVVVEILRLNPLLNIPSEGNDAFEEKQKPIISGWQ